MTDRICSFSATWIEVLLVNAEPLAHTIVLEICLKLIPVIICKAVHNPVGLRCIDALGDISLKVENFLRIYASKMKVIGAISVRKMDVVIMNEEVCMLMSESGFLLDLRTLDADLVEQLILIFPIMK